MAELFNVCSDCGRTTCNLITYKKLTGREMKLCYSCYGVNAQQAKARMNAMLGRQQKGKD